MHPALVTILPMFAAAVLVMAGGERLARREVEIRTPADRERLLDLAESFRGELARLDSLYVGHLAVLADRLVYEGADEAAADAASLAGVRSIRVFRKAGRDTTLRVSRDERRLPEVELEKRKRPLDPASAVILDANLLNERLPPDGRWLATPDPGIRLHCRQPEAGVLVVFLIDLSAVSEAVGAHLRDWLDAPLTPLREAGERVQVGPADGPALASVGPARHGPALSIVPTRTLSGDWQIRAWDGISVSRTRDFGTLAAAAALAVVFGVSGVLLWSQQRRALRLAAQRVSFVNRVSHELGTPLTNLSLNVDLATETLALRPAETRRRLGLVAEEIERLSRLVANVLTFSRRERDSLELIPSGCSADEVVQRTLESFRPALERRGIEIKTEISADGRVCLDSDALSQITGNLLSNVEKYAADGGWLWLGCRLEDDYLTVEVSDRGRGIPPHAKARIFAPFERVHNTTREGASGTGLGLAIGRDLAVRMGGTLELLESSGGAAFRLRIPAPPAIAVVKSNTDAA